ncbi:MAG: type II secretion system F family protein [Candidatus Altiarchaeales archaeon]|nr:type II secretion system F family protein [Candidatus Altiarchaeales archaeon]
MADLIKAYINELKKLVDIMAIGVKCVFLLLLDTVGRFVAYIVRGLMVLIDKFIPTIPPRIGSYFPVPTREKVEEILPYCGIKASSKEVLGMGVVYSVMGTLLVLVVMIIFEFDALITSIATVAAFFLMWVSMYTLILILIEKRTDNVEKAMPDYLSLISQNVGAGMTVYDAVRTAARPEFGALSDEIEIVSRDVLTGKPLEMSLIGITNRVKSKRLERTIKLIIQGIRSGGDLPAVLQEISRDLQEEQNLIERMKSETYAQVMFIVFAICVGAPMLFSVSIQFINVFTRIFEEINVEGLMTSGASTGLMMGMHGMSITKEIFIIYAIVLLTILSFFGAIIIGLMRSGKLITSSGFSMIPTMMIASLSIFLVLNSVLDVIFMSLMGPI